MGRESREKKERKFAHNAFGETSEFSPAEAARLIGRQIMRQQDAFVVSDIDPPEKVWSDPA